jgi:hypothetical protein
MVQFWLRRGEKLEPNKTTSMEKGLFVYFPDYLERVRKGGFTSNPQLCVSQVQMHVWCPGIGWRCTNKQRSLNTVTDPLLKWGRHNIDVKAARGLAGFTGN